MNQGELTFAVTALSNAIANALPNDDDLALAGAIFTQLGDTLTTVSTHRSIIENKLKKSSPASSVAGSRFSTSTEAQSHAEDIESCD